MAKIDILNLPETGMVQGLEGQKILIYGSSSVGKTFQSTRMKKPLLLMCEAGGNARNCPKQAIDDWDDFTTVVKQLTGKYEEAKEKYQTIIIDVVEELVARSEEKVAKRYGVTEIGMVQQASKGNPNGYSVARAMFKQQINMLCNKGYTVVFLSHEQLIEEYKDPLTEEVYPKYVPYGTNKEKGSTRFVMNICDFVFYVQSQGISKETGDVIYSKALCKETKSAFARSRYAVQTFIDPFTAENMVEAIEKAIAKSAEDEGAGLVLFKQVDSAYTKEDYFDMCKPYVTKLFKLYPDYVIEVIENQLGEGRKLTSASDDEITELGNIYNELVSFCCDRGIVIED